MVAANEETEIYNSAGSPDIKFMSCLPNGSEKMVECTKVDDLTILDVVYSAEHKTISIVDILHWKHFPFYETGAEFRHFMLTGKYAELIEPTTKDTNNEYPITMIEKHPCSLSKIQEAISGADYKIEGLLFFKKESTYITKDTEDCLWLKLDKLEEVLGLSVPDGVQYSSTNSHDEKRREEQESRKKLRAERLAAKDKQNAEKEEQQTTLAVGGDENSGSWK